MLFIGHITQPYCIYMIIYLFVRVSVFNMLIKGYGADLEAAWLSIVHELLLSTISVMSYRKLIIINDQIPSMMRSYSQPFNRLKRLYFTTFTWYDL